VRAGDAPRTRALRGWQRRASVRYLTAKPRDFLLVATPGAKTAFALRIAAIPFVRYEPDGNGVPRPAADHTYGYADALADGVVRPVVFLAYSGETRWRDSAGAEYAARLGEPVNAEHTARAWRTALDPAGEWMPAVISAADTRLQQLRDGGTPLIQD
jgi:superfamily II DNA or RNA helicase